MMLEHVLPNLKAFVILFQTSASGIVNFVYSWENSSLRRQTFKVLLNTPNSRILHFKCTNENPEKVWKTKMKPAVSKDTFLYHFILLQLYKLVAGGGGGIGHKPIIYYLFAKVKKKYKIFFSTVLETLCYSI